MKNKINKYLTKRDKTLLVGLMIIGLGYLIVQLSNPYVTKYYKSKTTVTELIQEKQLKEDNLSSNAKILENCLTLKQDIILQNKQLPNTISQNELLSKIFNLSEINDVDISKYTFAELKPTYTNVIENKPNLLDTLNELEKNINSNKITNLVIDQPDYKTEKELIGEITISLSLISKYENLKTFLHEIENAKPMINIKNISINQTGNDILYINLNISQPYYYYDDSKKNVKQNTINNTKENIFTTTSVD